jgi:hypothetical protein
VSIEAKNFLKARRDRALGSVLGYAEREIFPSLTPEARRDFRSVVIDSLNSYHDSVLDLVKADNGSVRNERVIELLERLDAHLTSVR